jgi:hypothetical protein
MKSTRRLFIGGAAASALLPRALATESGLILAYRVSPRQWTGDTEFRGLLDTLGAIPRGVDEVSLFDEVFPQPAVHNVESLRRLSQLWGRRLAQLKQAGYRAGINVLWTIGHSNVPGAGSGKMRFQPMVGHDGSVSDACACPNDPANRDYIRQKYRAAALANPDFIWVDDDFRSSYHGPVYPCFCPICLARFNRQRDRAELVRALNAPAGGALRRDWSEFCATTLEDVARDIARAVKQAGPDIEMGLMTIGYSHSTYGGYAFPRWMRALGARRGRPGHGFYTDERPLALTGKTLDAGRQIGEYPAEVRTIEYELENYPYVELDKAARTVLNECTLALMMGCTGIAFNMLKDCACSLADSAPALRAIAAERPAWEGLRRSVVELDLAGFWPAYSPGLMAARTVDSEGWFREGGLYNIQQPNELAGIGIPLTPVRRGSCGVILAGKVAEAFSTDELRTMLAGAVLLDRPALEVLAARGLGDLTGVRIGEKFAASVTERFTSHTLNGADRGEEREALVSAADNVSSLIPLAPEVASLATLIRYDRKDCGCCFSAYTNRLGGRVAVSTYSPWRRLGSGAKRRQLMAVMDWLSGGRCPVLIEQTVRVAPFVRFDAARKRAAAVLFNMSLDPTGPLTVRLRANPAAVRLIDASGEHALSMRTAGSDVVVEVPSLDAWHTAIIVGQ